MTDQLVNHLLQQSLENDAHLTNPATAALIIRLLQRSIEQNDKLLEEHLNLKDTINTHVIDEESRVKGLASAFPKKPDGTPDFEGHELFHATLIEESRARTLFYRELQHDLIKKGLWGLLMILGALIAYWWTGQLRGPQ